MSEPSDQPTRKSDAPPRNPLEAETRDAPPAPEPLTATAGTFTHGGDPPTASAPRACAEAGPISDPPGFVIIRELGSGGMGVVYEARQTQLNRLVALKVLKDGRSDMKNVVRFLKEAEAVAEIKHPNVVQVFEVGQHVDGPFMALELLPGGTLSDRLRSIGRFDPKAAAQLVVKLAGAVQAAHDLGIFHRDLKPGNVLFDRAGEPKVTDFGLAKKSGAVDLTRTQALMGTPAYMAPEQARGEARFVGAPADIWALGALLYECITGKRAFDADDTWALLRQVTDDAPSAPRTHVPGLPRDLELIALKCLEKAPADRYPSAAALAADLENYLSGRPVSVHPAGPIERTAKWVKRNPLIAGLVAAVALVLVVGSAVSLAFGLEAQKRGRDLARANDDLSHSNDELAKTNGDLKASRDEADALAGGLRVTSGNLLQRSRDLREANAAAEERGYLSDIALAHQLWRANDLRGMRSALERCPANRRRWEWHYLNGLTRPEREVYPTNFLPMALAYSPDGKLLAHVTMSGKLTVRNLAVEGEEAEWYQLSSPQSGGRSCALAFHPRGHALAFSIGHRVWVLNLETRQEKELTVEKPAPGESGPPSYLALQYTADGRLLGGAEVRSQEQQTITFVIRDVVSNKRITTLDAGEIPKGLIVSPAGAAFSPDGARFAASLVDSGIRVQAKDGDPSGKLFHPVVRVWDLASGKRLAEAGGSSALFGNLSFAPEGKAVGFGRRGGACELKLDGGQSVTGNHSGEVLAVAFDKNGLIWSGGEDKLICAHDRPTGEVRCVLRGCPNGILRLAVSPDGGELAAAVGEITGGGAIYRFAVGALSKDVWRLPAGREHLSHVAALAPDGSRFATCDFAIGIKPAEPRFAIRDVASGTRWNTEPAAVWFGGAFRPDGSMVVVSGENHLQTIDSDGKPGAEIPLPPDAEAHLPPRVTCSADGQTIAAVSTFRREKELTVRRARLLTWDAQTRKPGKSLELDLSSTLPPNTETSGLVPTGVALDRNGRLAASFMLTWTTRGEAGPALGFRGAAVVYDLATGEELFRQITLDPLCAVGFDPAGHVVAAGGGAAGGVVYGWDVETGRREFVLLGHTRPIMCLAFGPDGRLATGGIDRVVKVWDVASRREVLTLDGFAREVLHLAFTPDGKNLVAATGVDLVTTLMLATGLPSEWAPAEVRTFRGPK
jgi:serine/threonine protein kinase/WD40 repeat protein